MIFFFFFFSSRRRHTRLQGDWSSDVCSSDLSSAAFHGGSLGKASCQRALTPSKWLGGDRKSTRLNSSHLVISYAVFCLKKKKNIYGSASIQQTCAGTCCGRATMPRGRTLLPC